MENKTGTIGTTSTLGQISPISTIYPIIEKNINKCKNNAFSYCTSCTHCTLCFCNLSYSRKCQMAMHGLLSSSLPPAVWHSLGLIAERRCCKK